MSRKRTDKDVGPSESPGEAIGGNESKAESAKPKAEENPEREDVKNKERSAPNDLPNSTPETPTAIYRGSENSTATETLKFDIEYPKFEIKEPFTTMEVHHHPKVEKKDFKEYLLEGLMIFIAVMMGFFAESLREHINEQSRSGDYAVTLYSDLKLDTADLHNYLIYFKISRANTDTLMQLLATSDAKNIPTGKLYYFGLFGGAHDTFTPHNATLMEMKSSGSLRFFGDKLINRKLALYDQLCQSAKLEQEKETGIYVETRKARARIFEFKYNEEANDLYHRWSPGLFEGRNASSPAKVAAAWAKIDSFKKTNPPLLSYDQTLFNEYIELVRSRFLNVKVSQADSLMAHSTELLGLLKKKYDLKDE
jgi:hypothetical protein